MKITKKDLKVRVIHDLGMRQVLAANEEGVLEPQMARFMSFGLSQHQVTLSLAQDVIKTGCPTAPVTGCKAKIEFDAGELEELFKGAEALQTSCPGCQKPLGLIKSKSFERSFFFGWLP